MSKKKKKKKHGTDECIHIEQNSGVENCNSSALDDDSGSDDDDEHEIVSRRQRLLYDTLEEIHSAQHKHSDIYRSLLQIDAKIQYYVHGHLVAMQTSDERRSMSTICERRNEYLGPSYLVEHEELYKRLLIQLRDPSSALYLGKLIFDAKMFDYQQYDRLARIAVESLYGMFLQRDEHLQLMYFIDDIVLREFNSFTQDPVNFLRANTFSSKLLTCFARAIGRPYLVQVLAPHLDRMLQNRHLLDLDPLRVYRQLDIEHDPQVKTRDQMMEIPEVQQEIAKRGPILTQYCEAIIRSVFENVLSIPFSIRWLCHRLSKYLEKRQSETGNAVSNAQRNSIVCSFFFLRFLIPVIVTPEFVMDNRVEPATTEERALLTNISRVIDKLSNMQLFDPHKEWYYQHLNTFLEQNAQPMCKFINKLISVEEDDHLDDIIFRDATTFSQHQFLQVEKGDLFFLHTEIVSRGAAHMDALGENESQLLEQLGPLEATGPMLADRTCVIFRYKTPKLPAIRRHPGMFVSNQITSCIQSLFSVVDLITDCASVLNEHFITAIRSVDQQVAHNLEQLPDQWRSDNFHRLLNQAMNQCSKHHTIVTLLRQDEQKLNDLKNEIHKSFHRCSSKRAKFNNFLLETKLNSLSNLTSPRKSPRDAPLKPDNNDNNPSDTSAEEIPAEYKNAHPPQLLRRQSSLFGTLLNSMKKKPSQPVTVFTFQELVEMDMIDEQQVLVIGPETRRSVVEFCYAEPGRVSVEIKPKQSSNKAHRRRSLSQFVAKSARRLSVKLNRRALPQDDDSIASPSSSSSSTTVSAFTFDTSLSLAGLEDAEDVVDNSRQMFDLDEILDSAFNGIDSSHPATHAWHSLTFNIEPLLRQCAKMFFNKSPNTAPSQ